MELIVLFVCLIVVKAAPSSDLYQPQDEVEILNIDNFKNLVENSTNAWLVEFYANWCGYCQRFSRPWKKFAKEVVSWRSMVRVGVLACSDKKNAPICREYEINTYPTVRYFRENYGSVDSEMGVVVSLDSDFTVEEIKKTVIERFVDETRKGWGTMYPILVPYNHSDLLQLFPQAQESVEFVFLIFEKSGRYLGAEIALDLHGTTSVSIRYSFSDNTDLVDKLEIKNFPSVVVVDKNNNTEIFTRNLNTKNEVKAAIIAYLQEKSVKIVETVLPKIVNSSSDSNHVVQNDFLRLYIKNMGDVIFQTDLEAALRYSLEQEVATVKLIKDEQLVALNAYLKIIKKYFPFGYNNTNLIKKLVNLSSNLKEIKGAQIQVLMEKANDNTTFSSNQRFLGCLGSTPKYRGYTCSLWRLFHFLTVNSFLSNANKKRTKPREVLDAVHGYVKHFFSCKYCSVHFQKMAIDRNLTSVGSLDESVFWLWEAHNAVNARLKGDVTEDPEYPKNQFPAMLNCPECYDGQGLWKKSEVLKYLTRMYGKYNVRYIGSDTRILFPGLN